jgi:hypothetical protein
MLKAVMVASLLAMSEASLAVCSLTQTSAGIMVVDNNSPSPTSIASTHAGGVSGSVTVSCDSTGAITVANPVPTGAGAIAAFAAGADYGADVQLGGVVVASISRSTTSTTSAISSGVYQVNAFINHASGLPAGDYTVTVTTTLVAN